MRHRMFCVWEIQMIIHFAGFLFHLNVPGVSNGNVMNYIYVLTLSGHNILQVLFFTAGISERERERER